MFQDVTRSAHYEKGLINQKKRSEQYFAFAHTKCPMRKRLIFDIKSSLIAKSTEF
jgi:hypothetical protein